MNKQEARPPSHDDIAMFESILARLEQVEPQQTQPVSIIFHTLPRKNMNLPHGVPEGGQKQKKLLGYDTYIF